MPMLHEAALPPASCGRRARQVIGFDDTLGKFVAIVTETSTLARGKKTTFSMHFVYDQQSGRKWIAEAQGWRSPPR